jgi:integrase
MDFIETLIGRPNTIKTYKSLFYKHIKPLALTQSVWAEQDLSAFIRIWRNENLSTNTIKTLTSLLCQYIKWQTGQELSAKQTLRTVSKQNQETELEVPSKSVLYGLIDQADKKLRLPLILALFTGMRKGEVMGLKWSDIDFVRDLLTVRRSYNGPTKNGKTRLIPMHPKLREELLAICPRNSDNYLEIKVIPDQFDPNKNLQKLCKRTKIKPITFHTLRHCFASYGLEGGIDFNKIQKILGHSNLSTTVNFYWTSKFKPEEVDLTFI